MLWQGSVNHLVPVTYVHNRGVLIIQGSGLEGFHCTYLKGIGKLNIANAFNIIRQDKILEAVIRFVPQLAHAYC